MSSIIVPKDYRDLKPHIGSVIDSSHPLSQDLVGCWFFNNGSGNIIHDICGKYNAVPFSSSDTINYIPTIKGITITNGLTLGRLTTNKVITPPSNAFTIEAIWYVKDKTDTTNKDSGIGSWSTFGYMLYVSASGSTSRTFRAYANLTNISYTYPSYETWYHVVGTWDGKFLRLYVDGKSVANPVSASTLTASGQNFVISQFGTADDRSFYGKISKVALYFRALSPSEIQSLYIAPYQFIRSPKYIFYSLPTYSRGAYDNLLQNDSDLSTLYSKEDVDSVATNDSVIVDQASPAQIAVHQFRDGVNTNASITCIAKSTTDTSISPVYLQAYRFSAPASITDMYRDVKPPLGSQIDWNHHLSQGLIGCWMMNEGGGKTISDLTNTRDAVINDLSVMNWKNGNINFSSSENAYIDISSTKYDFTTVNLERSYLFWFKTTAGNAALLGCRTAGSGNPVLDFQVGFNGVDNNNTGKLSVILRDSDGQGLLWTNANRVLNDNKFHQAVFTFSTNKTVSIYSDGLFETSATTSLTTAITTAQKRIGDESENIAITNFVGEIQLVQIFDTCLSATEIRSLYISPYQMIVPKKRITYFIPGWETIDTNNNTAHGNNFTLSGTISDVSEYKDSNNRILCRVYQDLT